MDWKLILQIAGVMLGLLYLWLEYRADIRLWIVGLVINPKPIRRRSRPT